MNDELYFLYLAESMILPQMQVFIIQVKNAFFFPNWYTQLKESWRHMLFSLKIPLTSITSRMGIYLPLGSW